MTITTSTSTLMEKDNHETQFELLCNYGSIVASRSIVVKNDERDEHPYSVYAVLTPFPTFEEYAEGEEFEEGELIANCLTAEEVNVAQLEYKLQQVAVLN